MYHYAPAVRALLACLLGAGGVLAGSVGAYAYTPESPEVQEIIRGGSEYLLAQKPHARVGGEALVGLALSKSGAPQEHPRIQAALSKCQEFAATVPQYRHDVIYDAGLALIFFCEIDPFTYHQEIEHLVEFFVTNQKSHGGFGYAEQETGDNSMTQYAALGLWLAQENRFEVPVDTLVNLLNWIMAVQDPSGAFGYQGVISPPGKPRVRQSQLRLALATAGLCSLYVTADALDLGSRRVQKENAIPAELVEITDDGRRRRQEGRRRIDLQALQSTKELGNEYMTEKYKIDGARWQFYYLYALERWKAFQELDSGQVDPDPVWYDEGVEFIQKHRREDGSIKGLDEDAVVGTAFAILFLTRGTTQTIRRHVRVYQNGLLSGGRGLPTDLSEAELRDGKLVNVKEIPETDRFLELLQEDDGALDSLIDSGVSFDLNLPVPQRNSVLAALRIKVRQGSYAARRMAIRTLREAKDFDSVPVLIYALSDPDVRVVKEARDALRFISRKIEGFGLPPSPSPMEAKAAAEKWKTWYRSLRPDAVLLD